MPDIPQGGKLSRIKLLRPLAIPPFRLLWTGSILSYLGGQLTFVAFPWLVLKLTGDALVMGTVLAVASVPRALFMVVGGAMTDRFSPRTVMLWANWLRMVLMIVLAALVYTRLIEVWMIFVVAFLFGSLDAFFWPASQALLPRLLPAELLTAGNSLMQGMGQLSVMLGPALAGVIITLYASHGTNASADLPGIAVVFLLDSLGYIFSGLALLFIREPRTGSEVRPEPFTPGAMIVSIVEGFTAVWRDLPVRLATAAFTLFSLFFRGPYLVGIPVLCNARFTEGALAYGMIGSAFGVGSLVGLMFAGTLPRPREKRYGLFLLLDFVAIGGSFIVYAYTPNVHWAMLASAVTGITDGYMGILMISWIQTRVPTELLGRVMGMIMFFNNGVAPISAAVAGALISLSLSGVFVGSGAILIVLTLLAVASPTLRTMGIRDAEPTPN